MQIDEDKLVALVIHPLPFTLILARTDVFEDGTGGRRVPMVSHVPVPFLECLVELRSVQTAPQMAASPSGANQYGATGCPR